MADQSGADEGGIDGIEQGRLVGLFAYHLDVTGRTADDRLAERDVNVGRPAS
jgi:hypothetical protein